VTDEQNSLLKASDINSMDAFEFHHPLNPNSEIYLRFLGCAVLGYFRDMSSKP